MAYFEGGYQFVPGLPWPTNPALTELDVADPLGMIRGLVPQVVEGTVPYGPPRGEDLDTVLATQLDKARRAYEASMKIMVPQRPAYQSAVRTVRQEMYAAYKAAYDAVKGTRAGGVEEYEDLVPPGGHVLLEPGAERASDIRQLDEGMTAVERYFQDLAAKRRSIRKAYGARRLTRDQYTRELGRMDYEERLLQPDVMKIVHWAQAIYDIPAGIMQRFARQAGLTARPATGGGPA